MVWLYRACAATYRVAVFFYVSYGIYMSFLLSYGTALVLLCYPLFYPLFYPLYSPHALTYIASR